MMPEPEPSSHPAGAPSEGGDEATVSRRQRADAMASPVWVQKLHALELEQQTSVELAGLGKSPELNGQTGVIVGRNVEKGRYRVLLDGSSREVALRPGNLLLCRAGGAAQKSAAGQPPPHDKTSAAHHSDAYPACAANQQRIYPWLAFDWGSGDCDVEQLAWRECLELLQKRVEVQLATAKQNRWRQEQAVLDQSLRELRQTTMEMHSVGERAAEEDWVLRGAGQQAYSGTMKTLLQYHEERELRLPAKQVQALLTAAENGDVEKMKALLTRYPHLGPMSCTCTGWGTTLLHAAADHDQPELLGFLLTLKGADTRVRNLGGDTVLLSAVREGSVKCVELLLEGKHSHPDEATRTGWCDRWYTGAHLALSLGVQRSIGPATALKLLQRLCEAGAAVDSPSRTGEVPLTLAVKNNLEPAVRYLMQGRPGGAGGADFNFARLIEPPHGGPSFKSWTFLVSTRPESGRVCSSFTIRQLVLPAVVAQELRCPGSVDEQNLLGLRPSTGKVWYGPGSLAGFSGEQRDNDPDPARLSQPGGVAPSCCLHCGSERAKHLCQGCKTVRFCGRECQKGCWSQHKHDCGKLAAHRLPRTVRVIRIADGAVVASPEAMNPSPHCYATRLSQYKQAIASFVRGVCLAKAGACGPVAVLASQPQLLQMIVEQLDPPLVGCRDVCGSIDEIRVYHQGGPDDGQGAPPSDRVFGPNTVATVTGVVSQPELNRQRCVVEAYDRRKGRFVCRMQRDGRQLRLKPECCVIRCPCESAAVPCGSSCTEHCAQINPLNHVAIAGKHGREIEPGANEAIAEWQERFQKYKTDGAKRPGPLCHYGHTQLSVCAAAHRNSVVSLTPEQRGALYPLACLERWTPESCRGSEEGLDSCRTATGSEGYAFGGFEGSPSAHAVGGTAMVTLESLLEPYSAPCVSCKYDCKQYFCFCMNRPVIFEMVRHCSHCGKCFYHRRHKPSQSLRCSFCHAEVEQGPEESKEAEEESQRRGFWANRDPAAEARIEAAYGGGGFR